MKEKRLGETNAISGQNEAGFKYNIFCMKDSLFVMKMMSTYGTLHAPVDQEDTYRINTDDGSKEYFKYGEVFANHYKYRHTVDDNNNLRHAITATDPQLLSTARASRDESRWY
jgi:hypothetical protein